MGLEKIEGNHSSAQERDTEVLLDYQEFWVNVRSRLSMA